MPRAGSQAATRRSESVDAGERPTHRHGRCGCACPSPMVGGVAPEIAIDGRLELREARHPLLIREVRSRLADALPEDAPAKAGARVRQLGDVSDERQPEEMRGGASAP